TLTWIGGHTGNESDLNADLTWISPMQMPNKMFSAFGDFYHHDFKRLANGHYMVLGSDYMMKPLPTWLDVSKLAVDTAGGNRIVKTAGAFTLYKNDDNYGALVNLETINEFDKNDQLVWQWKSEDYLMPAEVFQKGLNLDTAITQQLPHLNAFWNDDKNGFVYASFKNLDRIVKIDKKTGKVVYAWGRPIENGNKVQEGFDFFRRQHGVRLMPDGSIAVFNNSDMHDSKTPAGVVIFSQPVKDKPSKIVWEYKLNYGDVAHSKSWRGGNIDVLPNGNYLVCTGALGKTFEITKDKKIVWSATAEDVNDKGEWKTTDELYRSHYSSSLYPCYFTAQTDADSINNADGSFKLRIFNTGTDPDTYFVQVTSASGAYNTTDNGVAVKPGRSCTLTIKPVTKAATGSDIEITIRSNTNTDKVRRIRVKG
ncbi:MAG TPA: aryl-sulfate sulfotransferase, partial [Chitinophagales bacterium]|nr:aryl-sulfate sulfotransferase [Chitinophagales bacterium]